MITIAIDDRIELANDIADKMRSIDPGGKHFAETDQNALLERVADSKCDIVWLDIEMPGMSGLELAAEIKKISPYTNIVFATAYTKYALEAWGIYPSGYLVKPATEEKLLNEIENLRHPVVRSDDDLLRIRCFGNFEAFKNGKRIHFSRAMSKEALAYLVDRRGSGCTVSEICMVLWEDRDITVNLRSQCRVILATLKRDLAAVGAEDVLVKMRNSWSIDPDKISCDYYDFLKSDSRAVNEFQGEYMAQYAWAELTIASLYDLSAIR